MNQHAFISAVFSCFFIMFVPALSSAGDRSLIYIDCVDTCMKTNCTLRGETYKHQSLHKQEFWCLMLKWSCREECRYQCMWHTVKRFQRVGQEPPKFHGKWPFARFMGMQEPASAFASVLNLMANAHMYKKIRREFPIRQAFSEPIIAFWHGFALVCVNAWVWSTIFHMRDRPFTEFMDYACALSMVMGLFIASVIRACYNHSKLARYILVLPLIYFVSHVLYLYEGVINYDYNMKLNVFFGALGSIIWLGISYQQWARGHRYAWRMAAFTMLSAAALTLELFDFPPYRGWDAHALWHLCTAPLPLLFYKYVIEDLRFLRLREVEKFAFKLT